MRTQLKNITTIQFGYYEKPKDEGSTRYLQVKHFNESGLLSSEIKEWIEITDKSENHLLEDGDIVFVGKGMRNFAWKYSADMGNMIASSVFFVIKPKAELVDADYLTTIFNSTKYQSFFSSLGAGSSIPSIRKTELEAVEVPLPPIEIQKKIAKLNELHYEEIRLAGKLIDEKNKLFQAVINDILK